MKVAIIRLSALGDIIQSAIVLQFIKKFDENIEIHWFVDERFKEILVNHPLIDKIYTLALKDKKIFTSLKTIFKAKNNKYDVVIDLQGLIKSAFVARLLSTNTFGYDKGGIRENFASTLYNQKFYIDYNENIILRNLFLVSFVFNEELLVDDVIFKEAYFFSDKKLEKELIQKLRLSKENKNILIHTGSSIENKIYPKEKLALLCKLISNHYPNAKIFLAWGNEKEFEFAKYIVSLSLIESKQIEILPKLTLQELISITKLSDLIIGNDSGPTHLAFAMNRPSVAIFGATPSKRNAFTTEINKVVDAGKRINNAKNIDKNDFSIWSIDENKIFKVIEGLLE